MLSVGIGGPVDWLNVLRGELAPVERARSRPVFLYLVHALVAQQVSARQKPIHVVSILGAASTDDLWLPLLVFHDSNVRIDHCSV